MGKIKLSDCTLDLNKFDIIISICTFGSYNESCFDKSRSDIDVMILLNTELQWEEELEIEDYLQTILPHHFKHKDIHYTFVSNFIPNKSGPEIVDLSSTFGFISSKDSKKLQGILKLRNRYTHDYYQRKLARNRILDICRTQMKTLDMFLEVSTKKITLVLNDSIQ